MATDTPDELSLPKATVTKIIYSMLPQDILTCSKDSRDLLINCCVEFIRHLTSESNILCEKEKKKTVSPEHVLSALETLGYAKHLVEIKQTYECCKQLQKEKDRKWSKTPDPLADEKLLEEQEHLFKKARQSFFASHP